VGHIEHQHLEEKGFAAAKQWSAKDAEQGVLRAERERYCEA